MSLQNTSYQAFINGVVPTIGERQKAVLRAVQELTEKNTEGVTTLEVQKHMNIPINHITGRMTELSYMGAIKDSGKRRKQNRSRAIVWVIGDGVPVQKKADKKLLEFYNWVKDTATGEEIATVKRLLNLYANTK